MADPLPNGLPGAWGWDDSGSRSPDKFGTRRGDGGCLAAKCGSGRIGQLQSQATLNFEQCLHRNA
jgi:hypothetical protein